MTFSEAKASCEANKGFLTSVNDRYLSKVLGKEQNLNTNQNCLDQWFPNSYRGAENKVSVCLGQKEGDRGGSSTAQISTTSRTSKAMLQDARTATPGKFKKLLGSNSTVAVKGMPCFLWCVMTHQHGNLMH